MEYQIYFEQLNRNERYQSNLIGETIENYVFSLLKKENYPKETIIEIYINHEKQEKSIQFTQINNANSKKIRIFLILMKEIKFYLQNDQNDQEKKLQSLSINVFDTFQKVEKELQEKYFFDQRVQIVKSELNMDSIIFIQYQKQHKQQNILFSLKFIIKVTLLYEYEKQQIELNAFQTISQIKRKIQVQYQNLDFFLIIRQQNQQQLDSKSNINDLLQYFQIENDEIIILKQIKVITVRISNFQKSYQIMLNESSENFIKFICQDNDLVYDEQIKLSHKKKQLQFDKFQTIKHLFDEDASIDLNLEYFKQNSLEIVLIQASNIFYRQSFSINPKQTVQKGLKLTELDQSVLMNGQQILDFQKAFDKQGINKRTLILQYQNIEQLQNQNDLSKYTFSNQIRLFGKDIQKFVNYKIKNQVSSKKIQFQDFFNPKNIISLQLDKKSYQFIHLNQKFNNEVFIYKNQFIQLEDKNFNKLFRVTDIIFYSKYLEVLVKYQQYCFERKFEFQEQVKTIKKNFIEQYPIFQNQSFQFQWDQNDSILDDNDYLEKFKNESLKLELKIWLPSEITLKFKFQEGNITRTVKETYSRYLINLQKIKTALINKYKINQNCILYFQNEQVNLQQNCYDNGLIDNDLLEFKKEEIIISKIEIKINHNDVTFSLIVNLNQSLLILINMIQEKIQSSNPIILFYDGNLLPEEDHNKTLEQLKIKDGDDFEVY